MKIARYRVSVYVIRFWRAISLKGDEINCTRLTESVNTDKVINLKKMPEKCKKKENHKKKKKMTKRT